jgi:AcrR family transcriptional regulator
MKGLSEKRIETDRSIRNSYLELRRKKSAEPVKVAGICREANISRRTFYDYYDDVDALNDACENEIIRDALKNFRFHGMIYNDPVLYFTEFSRCLQPVKGDLKLLANERSLEQLKKIEKWIVRLGMRRHTEEEEMFLTMIVAGSVALSEKYRHAGQAEKPVLGMKSLRLVEQMLALKAKARPGERCVFPDETKETGRFKDLAGFRTLMMSASWTWMYYLLR